MSAGGSADGALPVPAAAGALGMFAEVECMAGEGYVVNELLARGGMAEVHLGICLRTRKQVALKSVRPELLTAELEARLIREAELLQRLSGPEFPRFIAFGLISGRMRLVMELVDGESLVSIMKRERVPLTKESRRGRVVLVQRLAEAMGQAHAEGVAHRDLKPDNLMVRPEGGGPVVIDWGIAAQVDGEGGKMSLLTRTNVAPGTPYYMAPEQAKGRCLRPAKADVYALGVLLFELLSGDRPVPALQDEAEVGYLLRLQKATPRPLRTAVPWADAALEVICEKALTLDPEQRPTAAALAGQLGRWLNDEPVEWRRVTARERLVLAMKRRPKTWAAGAAGFLFFAGMAVKMTLLRNDAVRSEHVAQQQTQRAEAQAELALRAQAAEQRISAASDVMMAQESLERSGPEAAMPFVARALRRDPENESAGWLAGQLLAGHRPLTRVSTVAFSDQSDAAIPREPVPAAGGVMVLRNVDGFLYHCHTTPDGGLHMAPWPEGAPPWGRCVGFSVSKDGDRLVLVREDGALRLYEVASGRLCWEQPGEPARLGMDEWVRISASGRLVIQGTVSRKGEAVETDIRVRRAADGQAVRAPRTYNHYIPGEGAEVTQDDRWLVTGAVHETWLGCTDLMHGDTRDLTHLWFGASGNAGSVFSICPLPDSNRVLLAGQEKGYRVKCIDVAVGTLVWDEAVLGPTRAYTLGTTALTLAPGGQFFCVAGSQGDVMMHRIADGKSAGPQMNGGLRGYLIYFVGKDQLVVSGDTSSVWDWRSGERLASSPVGRLIPCREGRFMRHAEGQFELWKTGEKAVREKDFQFGRGRAFFDLDASRGRLLAGAEEGAVQVVNLATWEPEGGTDPYALEADARMRRVWQRPRLAANGSAFVTWEEPNVLRVHALDSVLVNQPERVAREQPIQCAALSPDGRVLAFALKDGSWEAWDWKERRQLKESKDLCKSPIEDGAQGMPGMAMCMEFSAEGERLAIGTQHWCTVSVWQTSGDWPPLQRPLMAYHSVSDLCFAPGRKGVLWSVDFQGECQHFDQPPYEKQTRPVPAIELNVPVLDAAISGDGLWFAAAAWNRKALIFNTRTLQLSPPALEHTGDVNAVDWSPDGRRLLTGTAAGEVNVWDRVTGRRVYSWPQDAAVVQAAFGLNGSRIIIARVDGLVRMREIYDHGRRPDSGTPDLLEKVSGSRVENDGQLVPVAGE